MTANEFIAHKEAEPGGREVVWNGVTLRYEHCSCVPMTGYPEFVASVERFRRTGDGGIERRFAYWKHLADGRWGFANRPLVIPEEDLPKLLDRARKRGTL
ncbi:MAG: hypothetical protein J2P45_05890 [Candidatus Dormibacteraeota bacterium]|nr:hypothetical protein [Candidatus Dormibacteraeota bacterium]